MKSKRGIPIVQAKFSKEETDKRLRAMFRKQLASKNMSKEELNARVEHAMAKRAEIITRTRLKEIEGRIVSALLKTGSETPYRQPRVARCAGTSRIPCPECRGKLKKWAQRTASGRTSVSLLCPKCGWTNRPNGNPITAEIQALEDTLGLLPI